MIMIVAIMTILRRKLLYLQLRKMEQMMEGVKMKMKRIIQLFHIAKPAMHLKLSLHIYSSSQMFQRALQ